MASDRHLLSVLAAPAALFVSGAGAAWAARYGFWASAAVCLLVAAWATALMIARARRAAETPVPAPPPPRPEAAGRDALTLGAILDHSPAPLLARGEGGDLRALNRAARRLFGTDDLISAPPPDLIAALTIAEPGSRATAAFSLDNRQRAYSLSVADLVEGSRPLRLAALIDIQAELQAAEAAALRELVSVLSHEIMNSLTPVTSLAETARDALASPRDAADIETAQEAVDTLARRASGLLRFVEAYRALARLPTPRPADTALDALLDEAARLFESRWSSQGVTLFQSAPTVVRLPLDADLIMQALINLLSNAAEAALEGAARPEVRPEVRLETDVGNDGRVSITVSDSGPGIGALEPEALFRAFFTTKPEGTGVGLSLARQIVRAHGGDLTYRPGEAGAAFRIDF